MRWYRDEDALFGRWRSDRTDSGMQTFYGDVRRQCWKRQMLKSKKIAVAVSFCKKQPATPIVANRVSIGQNDLHNRWQIIWVTFVWREHPILSSRGMVVPKLKRVLPVSKSIPIPSGVRLRQDLTSLHHFFGQLFLQTGLLRFMSVAQDGPYGLCRRRSIPVE